MQLSIEVLKKKSNKISIYFAPPEESVPPKDLFKLIYGPFIIGRQLHTASLASKEFQLRIFNQNKSHSFHQKKKKTNGLN